MTVPNDRRPTDLLHAYDRSPVALLTTTADGVITACNRVLGEHTGHAESALVGTHIRDLLTVGSQVFYETHVAPILQLHGHAREIALELRSTDGSRLHALTNAQVEHDAEGRPNAVWWAILIANDRREYERELLAAKTRAESSERHARRLASTLQQTLIPSTPPKIPGLDVGAVYRPAGDGHEIGGDFYDVFQVSRGHWIIALGDVQGKGVEAAVVTALARFSIRSAAVEHDDPTELLAVVNHALRMDSTDRLCTAVVIRLDNDGSGWRATAACAGHPPPMLRRDGAVTELDTSGRLLGFYAEHTSRTHTIQLRPGDTLLTYTDGVSEARSGASWFGEERIAEVLRRARGTADDIVGALLDDVLTFEDGRPRDDIAMVAATIL